MIAGRHEQLSPITVGTRAPGLRDKLKRGTEIGDSPGTLGYVSQRSATLRQSTLNPWGELAYGRRGRLLGACAGRTTSTSVWSRTLTRTLRARLERRTVYSISATPRA